MEKTECDTLIDALVRQRTNDTVQTILFILFSSGKKSVLRKEQTEQKKKKKTQGRGGPSQDRHWLYLLF